MSKDMEWSPDFCLACDRQSSGGAYCSQACRLADIERASGGSEPVSPTSSAPSASWASSCLGTGSGFYLPPPLNFDAYKTSSKNHASKADRRSLGSTPQSSYFPNISSSQYTSASSTVSPASKVLTPSSSRSSLSSIGSTQEAASLSDQARSELRGYASSFDQVRDWKRRMISP